MRSSSGISAFLVDILKAVWWWKNTGCLSTLSVIDKAECLTNESFLRRSLYFMLNTFKIVQKQISSSKLEEAKGRNFGLFMEWLQKKTTEKKRYRKNSCGRVQSIYGDERRQLLTVGCGPHPLVSLPIITRGTDHIKTQRSGFHVDNRRPKGIRPSFVEQCGYWRENVGAKSLTSSGRRENQRGNKHVFLMRMPIKVQDATAFAEERARSNIPQSPNCPLGFDNPPIFEAVPMQNLWENRK